MVRAGLRTWLGLKVMTVLAALHLAFMASSHLKVDGESQFLSNSDNTTTRQFAKASTTTTTTTTTITPSFSTATSSSSSSSSPSNVDRVAYEAQAINTNTQDFPYPSSLYTTREAGPLKWAIFTPPKPFSKAPHQRVALRSWLNLRVPPQIFMIEADDLDPQEMEAIKQEYPGTQTMACQTNSEGFLLQSAIFERASMEQGFDVVVVVNADIILGDDFIDALEHAESNFERFLMIGARYDNLVPQEIPPEADAVWIEAFRARTLDEGALHTYGGSDYFAWRPVGDPALAAIGGRIPPFTYGRGKADNWIIDMAVKNGVVEVIDATTAIVAVHPAHGYENVNVRRPAVGDADASVAAAAAPVAPEDQLLSESQGLLATHVTEVQRERERLLEDEKKTAKAAAAALAVAPGPAPLPPPTLTTKKLDRRYLTSSSTSSTTTSPDPSSPTTPTGTVTAAADAAVKYVNYWSAKSIGDPQADMNKYLAYNFGAFQNGDGTPLHAPWQLMRCIEAVGRRGGVNNGGGGGGARYRERPCLRYRTRPGACPCEHSPMVARTLTDVETQGKNKLCGKAPALLREEFEEDFAFRSLIGQQAQNGTVVLIGFNSGYQDMLLNMVCRLQQLEVPNYVIAAFDAEAFAFCRAQVLPCFPVSAEIAAKAAVLTATSSFMDGSGSSASVDSATAALAAETAATAAAAAAAGGKSGTSLQAQAHAFGTQGFRALTKLKSQQVLRILELGYHVMWSDVDIFWKVDTIPGVWAEMGEDVDIAIQSNAPPEEEAENGHRRINSGFYLVKSTPASVQAFQQIVDHARQSKLSEQPSFYTVLCGDAKEYVQGKADCVNTMLPVKTRLLDRSVYPNGAMVDVLRGVTPTTEDDVAIVHFNWLEGHDAKVESFVNASMWLLDGQTGMCLYDQVGGVSPPGERERGLFGSSGNSDSLTVVTTEQQMMMKAEKTVLPPLPPPLAASGNDATAAAAAAAFLPPPPAPAVTQKQPPRGALRGQMQ